MEQEKLMERIRKLEAVSHSPVDWNDDNKNIGKSKEILKRTKETLNEGKCLLVFPSSRLSKRKGFKLFERPWLNTIVKLSKKYNAPIIPFHMDGHNSLFYYFLDKICHIKYKFAIFTIL